jgi:GAF domain-containing protein
VAGRTSRQQMPIVPIADALAPTDEAGPEPRAPAEDALRSLELEEELTHLLGTGRELLDARYAALGVLDPGRVQLQHFVALGMDEHAHRSIGAPPQGHGLLGVLLGGQRPMRVHDLTARAGSHGFPRGHPQMRSFVGAPILIDGLPRGSIYFAEKRRRRFTTDDELATIGLAAGAAAIIASPSRPQSLAEILRWGRV